MGRHAKGRTTMFVLDPRRLKYKVGKHYRGEIETLCRAIRNRTYPPTYVYIDLPLEPINILLSPEPLERPGLDLVGVYDDRVTTAMLREDLPFTSVVPTV